jgi:FkbM family methyltransferase
MLMALARVIPAPMRTWIKDTVRLRIPQAYRKTFYGDTSQFGEVTVLKSLLPPGSVKWLVDVGAHDGVAASNSLPLIRAGWEAILIEPLPANFAALQKLHGANPRVRLVQCACAEQPGELPFYVHPDANGGSFLGTLSHDQNKAMQWTQSAQTIHVKVERLTDVLQNAGCPQEFSLLSTDTEGFDLEVFRGLDFQKFRPQFILTEQYAEEPQKDAAKFALLKENGYRFIRQIGCNSLWQRA